VKTNDPGRETCSVATLRALWAESRQHLQLHAASQLYLYAGYQNASRMRFFGSETKLSNGGLAGDDFGCNDANSSKHGKTTIVQVKIVHVCFVARLHHQAEEVCRNPQHVCLDLASKTPTQEHLKSRTELRNRWCHCWMSRHQRLSGLFGILGIARSLG